MTRLLFVQGARGTERHAVLASALVPAIGRPVPGRVPRLDYPGGAILRGGPWDQARWTADWMRRRARGDRLVPGRDDDALVIACEQLATPEIATVAEEAGYEVSLFLLDSPELRFSDALSALAARVFTTVLPVSSGWGVCVAALRVQPAIARLRGEECPKSPIDIARLSRRGTT